MDNALSVHMTYRTKKFPHVHIRHFFRKHLILLFGNFLEEFSTVDILHDEINIFFIDISLIILNDIWVIKFCQNFNLFLDGFEVTLKLSFVENLDSHFKFLVVDIMRKKNFTERSCTKNLSVVIDVIVQFQFSSTLLLLRF